jgi:transposase
MRRAQGGAPAQGIGRARGGLTTRIETAVDALGLPVRLIPTPGEARDCPQAAALIDGLQGVGHVIADAACGPDALRGKIEDERGAEAQIRANPSRAIKAPLDPELCAERHKVECVFQRIERFRRIALHCEKTRTSFMGFVFLVSALDWLR